MIKLYMLDPEVAGELGDESKIEYKNGMIDSVTFLHYNFFGWLGDELVTSTPCFIVAKSLADDIIQSNLTGCQFEKILQTKSEEFDDLYPNTTLPEFLRLVPKGVVEAEKGKIAHWSGHDFCLEKKVELYVSEQALRVIQRHKIDNCDVTAIESTPSIPQKPIR